MFLTNVLILAAGKGKRMHSDLPKVLHRVLHRPMLHYVVELAQSVKPERIAVVVGHGEPIVRQACESFPNLLYAHQEEQLGTGHAVRISRKCFENATGSLVVLCGDVILFKEKSLKSLLETHANSGAAATVVFATVENPTGYGRILRDPNGRFIAIREQGDCSETELDVKQINAGIYCFDLQKLFGALERVGNRNAQGEYYLTDVIEILLSDNEKIQTWEVENFNEVIGINTRPALQMVEEILRRERNQGLLESGVTLRDPSTCSIDTLSRISPDVEIEGNCTLIHSFIHSGVRIESGSRIIHSEIGPGTVIKQGSYIEESQIGPNCSVGPYAHLRPGSKLASEVKVGNFVELKKAEIGEGSKISHLSYVGDATVGKDVNLGCGFVTCNYDGKKKHQTVIEDHVFVGSDSQTVAPVRLGSGSYVASGTTVTEDVPAGSLVLSRGKQVTKPGYAKKYRSE